MQVLAWIGVAVAGLATGATPEVTYDASLRTELRAGSGLGVVVNGAAGGSEIAVIPSLTLHVDTGPSQFSLQYDPQLLLAFYTTESGILALQRGKVVAGWGDPVSGRQFAVSEDFQYGTTDFFSLTRTSATVTPQLQPLPAVTSLLYVYSNSQAILGLRLSSTWHFALTAGYLINGGADAVAQVALPLQRGPYALMAARKMLSIVDDLETSVLLYGSSFTTGSTNIVGEVTEGWIRRWSHYWRTDLAAGASGVAESPFRGAPYTPAAYPVLRATANELRQTTRGRTLTGNLLLEVAPYVDRLTGNTYERGQVLASADWSAPLGWAALAQAGYARPFYGNLDGAYVVELLGVGASYQPKPFLRFEAGIRGVWQQSLPGVDAPPSFQWVGFVGLLLKGGGPL